MSYAETNFSHLQKVVHLKIRANATASMADQDIMRTATEFCARLNRLKALSDIDLWKRGLTRADIGGKVFEDMLA